LRDNDIAIPADTKNAAKKSTAQTEYICLRGFGF